MHINISKRIAGVSLVSLLLLGLLMASPAVFAQTDEEAIESITLSPTSSRFQIDAGTVRQDELTILNDGDVAFDFIVYARPYVILPNDTDYANPQFDRSEEDASAAFRSDAYQWVQFDETSWRIEPGQTLKVPYTIRVPDSAAPGGHYGVIFAETQPEPTSGTAVARKKRVGSIIYATVNGTYSTGGQSLGISVPGVQFRAPLEADTTLENTGNADYEVKTKFTVSDLFGSVKYQAEKNHIILPSTTRKISLAWDNAPWFGLFNVSVQTDFLDQSAAKQSLVLIVPRWLVAVLSLAAVGGAYAAFRRQRR